MSTAARRRVLVFGTFDLFHAGHRSFLRQARRHGTELVVAIGRDRVVRDIKGQWPTEHERRRRDTIKRQGLVDTALLAPLDPGRRFDFIRRINPSVIALGYDQTTYTETLTADLRQRGIRAKIVRLRAFRPSVFKTSLIRRVRSRSHRKK